MNRFDRYAILVAAAVFVLAPAAQANRDPMGYADGMSLYQYVNGSPTRHVDPMGLQEDEIPIRTGADALTDATDYVRDFAEEVEDYTPFVRAHEFDAGTLHMAIITSDDMGAPGASMKMDFVPAERTEKCCDKIRILQFIQNMSGDETIYLAPEDENRRRSTDEGWYVDRVTDNPGESPYWENNVEGGQTGSSRAGDTQPTLFPDSPHMRPSASASPAPDDQRGEGYEGPTTGQELITCVVCTEGPDAEGGIATYGCVRWGWGWRAQGPPGSDPETGITGPTPSNTIPSEGVGAIGQWNRDMDEDNPNRINYGGGR